MKIRSLLIFSLLTFIIACVPPSKQEITQVDLDLNRNDIRQLIDLINADLSDSLYTYLNHIDPSLRFLATNANASLKTKMYADSVARNDVRPDGNRHETHLETRCPPDALRLGLRTRRRTETAGDEQHLGAGTGRRQSQPQQRGQAQRVTEVAANCCD